MNYQRLKSLRIFVIMLLILFVSETVHATGMMAANELKSQNLSSLVVNDSHSDHLQHEMQHQNHQHQANNHQNCNHNKSSSTHQCTKCGHCMACFTLLPPAKILNLPTQHTVIDNVLYKFNYLSHICAQPFKPPITRINS